MTSNRSKDQHVDDDDYVVPSYSIFETLKRMELRHYVSSVFYTIIWYYLIKIGIVALLAFVLKTHAINVCARGISFLGNAKICLHVPDGQPAYLYHQLSNAEYFSATFMRASGIFFIVFPILCLFIRYKLDNYSERFYKADHPPT